MRDTLGDVRESHKGGGDVEAEMRSLPGASTLGASLESVGLRP